MKTNFLTIKNPSKKLLAFVRQLQIKQNENSELIKKDWNKYFKK